MEGNMVRHRSTIRTATLILVLLLAGGREAEAKSMGEPVLQRDTMISIRIYVRRFVKDCDVQFVDAKVIRFASLYRWTEVWTVRVCKELYRFRVEYKTITGDGTDYYIKLIR
jgi:hypothetical protein